MFGRGVRPRVDNSDHRGQRVYQGSVLAVLYLHCLQHSSFEHLLNLYYNVMHNFATGNIEPGLAELLNGETKREHYMKKWKTQELDHRMLMEVKP